MADQSKEQSRELAIMKRDVVDVVSKKVDALIESGELHLPPNYSAANSLKSAWLILQVTVDKDKKPVLATCTKDSIANSLFDMIVQGLNPAKKQGYFIAYGNQLAFQRSYFGTMAVAKMVDPNIEEVVAEVVYSGDVFKYKIMRGRKEVTNHEQSLENVDRQKIVAAYAMIITADGEVRRTEIMTFEEIKQAWKQSKMYPIDDKGNVKAGSTHDKFTADMAMKTVINKLCKPIINSSNDSHLVMQAVRRSDDIAVEAELEQEIEQNANDEVIDIDGEIVTGEEYEPGMDDYATEPEPEQPIQAQPQRQQQPRPNGQTRRQTPQQTTLGGPGF